MWVSVLSELRCSSRTVLERAERIYREQILMKLERIVVSVPMSLDVVL